MKFYDKCYLLCNSEQLAALQLDKRVTIREKARYMCGWQESNLWYWVSEIFALCVQGGLLLCRWKVECLQQEL
jgi:hypothetical protein